MCYNKCEGNRMKKLKLFLLSLIIIPCCIFFTACKEEAPNIVSVEKTVVDEVGTVYEVLYEDGTTSYFVDKDTTSSSEISTNISLNDIYLSLVENGYEGSYFDFVKEYLSVDTTISNTQSAVAKAINSVVSIYTPSGSAGAGVIYKMDDDLIYILTNFHVIFNSSTSAPNSSMYAYLFAGDISIQEDYNGYIFDGDVLNCTYVGGSSDYDLAVISVPTSEVFAINENACAVTVADDYYLAETAIAIGNPNAEGISVSEGIVSVLSKSIEIEDVYGEMTKYRVMRIDTAINPGNSGGGLFNINGELIGIVNARRTYNSDRTDSENIAYALPCDDVSAVANKLIATYRESGEVAQLTTISLGISYLETNHESNVNNSEISVTSDLEIYTVTSGGLADEMGIIKGDIISALIINNDVHYLDNAYDLKNLLLKVNEGDTIAFLIDKGDMYKCTEHLVTADDFVVVD